MTPARLEAVTPELVLVCPELRASLVADYLANGPPPRPGRLPKPLDGWAAAAAGHAVAVPTGSGARTGATPPLALAAAAYATERLLWVVARGAVLVALLVLIILLASQVARV